MSQKSYPSCKTAAPADASTSDAEAPSPAQKTKACLALALRLLSRKPRSHHDLQVALAQEGHEAHEVAAAMGQVVAWGYINDERLGDVAQASAQRRKKGPLWLREQLRQHGLPHAVVQEQVAAHAAQAPALAQEILASRFGGNALADSRTVLRAMRLLQRRGFDGAVIRQALRQARAHMPAQDDFDGS